MTDLSKTIAPKSDQLNADDLISGPRTIKVTSVKAVGASNDAQPIAIGFEGDNNKPYKPCKSMRRALIKCWGTDGASYVGKYITLYLDPKVKFGGIEVGGIRISHVSDIEGPMTFAMTASKTVRAPYTVNVLKNAPPAQTAASTSPNSFSEDTTDFPIYNAKGLLVGYEQSIDNWVNFFRSNMMNLPTVERVEAIQKANMATFVLLNEKGFSLKVGEVKADFTERKQQLQQQTQGE